MLKLGAVLAAPKTEVIKEFKQKSESETVTGMQNLTWRFRTSNAQKQIWKRKGIGTLQKRALHVIKVSNTTQESTWKK